MIAVILLAAAALPSSADAAHRRRQETPVQSVVSLRPSETYLRELDELSALWSFYKFHYMRAGRVISPDESQITTSEGQSYAMLRAVWAGDHPAFHAVWEWTRQYLQVRGDRLFAWKWKNRVLDSHSATDADTDIALALILAARRFSEPRYLEQASQILDDIWSKEVILVREQYYVTAGDWAPKETLPVIHVAYLAPYAYRLFSKLDPTHPWQKLVESSDRVLSWIYLEKNLALPPETVLLDPRSGQLSLGPRSVFSYDAFPAFWRLAMSYAWPGSLSSHERTLRTRMLAFFQAEWRRFGRFLDRYDLSGTPMSRYEGWPLYATVHALATVEDPELADQIRKSKLQALWKKAASQSDTPYYLQNWLWFDRAFELNSTRHFDEFLGFLRPFDFKSFSLSFPWLLFGMTGLFYLLARFHTLFRFGFLVSAFSLCLRYLWWRLFNSLNFIEFFGPLISVALWLAEFYCFSTVALLVVQMGVRLKPASDRRDNGMPPPESAGKADFAPSVDVLIPIYSESCEILETTLLAAVAMDYPNKKIHVLDDSHREEVAALARHHGACYIKGPRKHAKAGNLNHALTRTQGELVAIFDTDHVPVTTFLRETVPCFADPKIGFVQTPHHFYNSDIFQRAFRASARIPNEQDMFNHAIQGGRNRWGGSFFVGSGAVFRRCAVNGIGGFNLMSITEDIHTSQHLHAAGWNSAFVDKDLAVGLTAENLASYIVQRRRWMLGCLQIFFKDNPLFVRGLPFRLRLGYFASLYYFFFPVARVIFWSTPLLFLLFHLHPIFSEVSVLLAYLLPYVVVLPLISSVLIPGWPRMAWGSVYEAPVSFPLFRSMFDLFLPKNLGFKVTPKGIRSESRSFDHQSSRATSIALAITLGAIVKGLIEFYQFGIEKDAYFFNLIWAGYNLIFLVVALLVAWERPQRRSHERIRRNLPFLFHSQNYIFSGEIHDISLSGVSFVAQAPSQLPQYATLTLQTSQPTSFRIRLVHQSKVSGKTFKAAYEFKDLNEEQRKALVIEVLASPETWKNAHQARLRSNWLMAVTLIHGIVRSLLPARQARSLPRPRLQLISESNNHPRLENQ